MLNTDLFFTSFNRFVSANLYLLKEKLAFLSRTERQRKSDIISGHSEHAQFVLQALKFRLYLLSISRLNKIEKTKYLLTHHRCVHIYFYLYVFGQTDN